MANVISAPALPSEMDLRARGDYLDSSDRSDYYTLDGWWFEIDTTGIAPEEANVQWLVPGDYFPVGNHEAGSTDEGQVPFADFDLFTITAKALDQTAIAHLVGKVGFVVQYDGHYVVEIESRRYPRFWPSCMKFLARPISVT